MSKAIILIVKFFLYFFCGAIINFLFFALLFFCLVNTFYKNLLFDVLQNGHFNEWLKIDNYNQKFVSFEKLSSMTSHDHSLDSEKGNEKQNNQWIGIKTVQLKNMQFNFPLKDPYWQIIPSPIFTKSNKKHLNDIPLSVKFFSPSFNLLGSLHLLSSQDFSSPIESQKIFSLPIFRNFLSKINNKKIFRDLFSLNIEESLKNLNILDHIYTLYIIYLRHQFLPKEMFSVGYNEVHNHGVVDVIAKDRSFKIRYFYYLQADRIVSFILTSRSDLDEGDRLRTFLQQNISLVPQSKILRDFIYQEFQGLNFSEKNSWTGVNLLFSSWSQEFENISLFQRMITIQEDLILQEREDFRKKLSKLPSHLSESEKNIREFYRFGSHYYPGRLKFNLEVAEQILSDQELLEFKIKEERKKVLENQIFSSPRK